jgi:hypothetical protein
MAIHSGGGALLGDA